MRPLLAGVSRRLGVPNTARRRPFLVAMIVDSLGTGVFLPFSVVYFVATSNLDLAGVGLALSVSAALSLPLSPVAGALIDRLGARGTAVGANVLQALGFAGYLVVDRFATLVLFSFLVAAGQSATWIANGALITECADGGERQQWFGLTVAFRNIGYGLGAVLAGVAVGVGGGGAYRAIVVANIVSFAVTAVVLAAWRGVHGAAQPAELAQPAEPAQPDVRSWPARLAADWNLVAADRAFRVVLALNVVFVLFSLVITVSLSVYLLEQLRAPAWLASGVFVINTVLVALFQAQAAKRLGGLTTRRVLSLTTVLWAGSFVVFALLSGAGEVVVVIGAIVGMVVYTLAEMTYSPTMPSLVGALAAPERRGRYFAVYQLSWNVPQVLAPAAFSALLDLGGLWLWGLLLALAAVTLVALSRTRWLPRTVESATG